MFKFQCSNFNMALKKQQDGIIMIFLFDKPYYGLYKGFMKNQALFYFFIICCSGWAMAQVPNLKIVPIYGEEQDTMPPSPLPKGLLATNATARLKTLKSLDNNTAQESWLEKIMEMALLDPAIPVRMEAKNTLNRIQPLNEAEKKLLFQLSSLLLHERSSALIDLKKHFPLKLPLQYAILKDIAFSRPNEVEEHLKGVKLTASETNINRLNYYFVEHHLLMQKMLLISLNYPYTQDRAQVILSSIDIHPTIQWNLLHIATALPSDYHNQREKAFWILVRSKSLRLEVEMGLIQVATYNSGKQYENVTLRSALTMDKSEVDSALLAYHILLKRSGSALLNHKVENELAYLAVSEKSNVSSLTQERARNILQAQVVLNPSTEKILINRLLFTFALDQTLNTVQSILKDRLLDELSQKSLLYVISSSSKSSSKAKKIARSLLLRHKYVSKDIIKKAGFWFQCQRLFALSKK